MLRNTKFLSKIRRLSEICKRKMYSDMASEVQRISVSKEDGPALEIEEFPHSRYGGESTVTLLTGTDDVGVEGSCIIQKIFEHINAPVQFEVLSADTDISDEVMLSTLRNGTGLYIETTHLEDAKKRSLILNTHLDLYASVVHCFAIPGFNSKFKNVDIAVIMQNNRGDFSKVEYQPVKGVVETLKIDDELAIKNYIEYAFKYAVKNKRHRITFGHKIQELPLSDGLHMRTAKKLQRKKYPEISIDFMLVNTLIRNLIWNAPAFDVLCLNDKYGTCVASVASGVCGGANLFCAGEFGDRCAIFKPLQTKLSIEGKVRISPYGCVSAAVALLNHLKYYECASKLWRGLMHVMVEKEMKTAYYGGECTEDDILSGIIDSIKESACRYS